MSRRQKRRLHGALFTKSASPVISGLDPVLAAKLIHATPGIEYLLLAGEEGVAFRTYFHVYFLVAQGRTRCKTIAAGTDDLGRCVLRMNFCFHDSFTSVPACRLPGYFFMPSEVSGCAVRRDDDVKRRDMLAGLMPTNKRRANGHPRVALTEKAAKGPGLVVDAADTL